MIKWLNQFIPRVFYNLLRIIWAIIFWILICLLSRLFRFLIRGSFSCWIFRRHWVFLSCCSRSRWILCYICWCGWSRWFFLHFCSCSCSRWFLFYFSLGSRSRLFLLSICCWNWSSWFLFIFSRSNWFRCRSLWFF